MADCKALVKRYLCCAAAVAVDRRALSPADPLTLASIDRIPAAALQQPSIWHDSGMAFSDLAVL